MSPFLRTRGSTRVKGESQVQADDEQAFTRFVKETEPRLSYALAAAYGPEVGADAAADALGYAWENWDRIRTMDNPAGYLYRVGQSSSRSYRRPRKLFPAIAPADVPDIEPGLPPMASPATSGWLSSSSTGSPGRSMRRPNSWESRVQPFAPTQSEGSADCGPRWR